MASFSRTHKIDLIVLFALLFAFYVVSRMNKYQHLPLDEFITGQGKHIKQNDIKGHQSNLFKAAMDDSRDMAMKQDTGSGNKHIANTPIMGQEKGIHETDANGHHLSSFKVAINMPMSQKTNLDTRVRQDMAKETNYREDPIQSSNTPTNPNLQSNEGEAPAQNVPPCSFDVRTRFLQNSCQTADIPSEIPPLRFFLIENNRPKSQTAGCVIFKAGTWSWRQYIADVSGIASSRAVPRCVGTLAPCNTTSAWLSEYVPMEKVQNAANNYTLYIRVRHPLQRAVSAFYEEAAQSQGVPGSLRKADGMTMSFPEYVDAITSKFMDKNAHYRRYTTFCGMCKVDYKFVLRTETTNSDMVAFNEAVGIDVSDNDWSVKYKHMGIAPSLRGDKNKEDYKYDSMLHSFQQQHPDLMRRLLDTYSVEMSALGYHWDWDKGKSSCWIQHNGSICC